MYKQEFQGDISISNYTQDVNRIAQDYFNEIEGFDRRVCSAVDRDGCGMPINMIERDIITKNAIRVKKKYLDKYFRGIPNTDFNRAIKNCR